MKPIIRVPNSVLTTPAKPVTVFDTKLLRMIADMKESLLGATNPIGVGLAAPQIGLPWQIFLTKPTQSSKTRVFINAQIVKKSDSVTDGIPDDTAGKGKAGKMEGCLSIPRIWGRVRRSRSITISYQDERGIPHTEEFSDFLATIIQHETDHIHGILFTQRVLEQKEKLYQAATDEHGKEVLEEIKLT